MAEVVRLFAGWILFKQQYIIASSTHHGLKHPERFRGKDGDPSATICELRIGQ